MASYAPEGVKGIIGGSDRIAAVEQVVSAAGGTLNHVSFVRGPYDIIVDMELPDADTCKMQWLSFTHRALSEIVYI